MANTKVTKKEMFVAILALISETAPENADVLTKFVENEIALLDKRAANKSASKTQKANEGIKSLIINVLAEIDKPATITEIQNYSTELAAYTNQKISALLTQMKKEGTVVKTIEKKKSYFSLGDPAVKIVDITGDIDEFVDTEE